MFEIEIITDINCKEYFELENLIKEFAINIFLTQKNILNNKIKFEKENIINNYDKYLLKEDLNNLESDLLSRIKLVKELINNKLENKITRFYVIKDGQQLIGFQTAQIRINQDVVEGWRNYAFIKPKYSGIVDKVKDIYGKIKIGNISNIVYENITQWFKENNVLVERTATGKNMYKNILTYIVLKGFVPEKVDSERIYLIKEYNNVKTKNELKSIYKNYIKKEI